MKYTAEREIPVRLSGWVTTILGWLIVVFVAYIKWHLVMEAWNAENGQGFAPAAFFVLWMLVAFVILVCVTGGNCTLQKNHAVVYTFMGNYVGTLRGPGYFATPFWWGTYHEIDTAIQTITIPTITVNDKEGNPILIGCNISASVTDTYAATFAISGKNKEYLIQKGEIALRTIAKKYPLTTKDEHTDSVHSLSNSSEQILTELAKEISTAYVVAGYSLQDTSPVGITTLTYAPEIAATMLQRQQAAATIEARELIVKGAVTIVQEAVKALEENDTVKFSDDNKQKMVSNLLIVLCSSHSATPVMPVGSN